MTTYASYKSIILRFVHKCNVIYFLVCLFASPRMSSCSLRSFTNSSVNVGTHDYNYWYKLSGCLLSLTCLIAAVRLLFGLLDFCFYLLHDCLEIINESPKNINNRI